MPTIPLRGLGNIHSAIVDDGDVEPLAGWHWVASKSRDGRRIYAIANIPHRVGRGQVFMHRVIMGARPGELIDHANRNTLDNRRANLRRADKTLNNANGHTGFGKSRFKGVYSSKSVSRPWRAQIQYGRRTRHIGHFVTEIDAARAYDTMARRLFGEFALCNFPEG